MCNYVVLGKRNSESEFRAEYGPVMKKGDGNKQAQETRSERLLTKATPKRISKKEEIKKNKERKIVFGLNWQNATNERENHCEYEKFISIRFKAVGCTGVNAQPA